MDAKELEILLRQGEGIELECKKAADTCPKSVWETYSAFANTNGGYILLGVKENKNERVVARRFLISGVLHAEKIITDFWNTINSDKVSANILYDEDVEIVQYEDKAVIVIHVPPADYRVKPVYINGNPLKGTFRRNHEGDYHCRETEVKEMFRDAADTGNDVGLLENYTMDDIDRDSLKSYRIEFEHRNPDHIWCEIDDESFLRNMGGMGLDRRTGNVWLTTAGLLMFGKGLSVRERFSNLRMDFIDLTNLVPGSRWTHRLTYDGTWENNLYQFWRRIIPWLVEGLKKPFRLEGMVRVDDTPVHRALREAVINMFIHADYMVQGLLKVEKTPEGFYFSNPGLLKISVEHIYEGGNAVARNPNLQTMFRMIGLGDNIGSGFPTILNAWSEEGWTRPELCENNEFVRVELWLRIDKVDKSGKASTDEQILALLKDKKMKMKAIIENIGLSPSGTAKAVKKLVDGGQVAKIRKGREIFYESK